MPAYSNGEWPRVAAPGTLGGFLVLVNDCDANFL